MKLKKSFWASLAITFILSSCATKVIPVPGDSQKTKENLYNEYMVIADSFFELEKYDKAITYYKLCMEKKNLYWAAYYKLAKSYVFQSNWNEAVSMYKVILERDPENDSIKASLAYIYAMQGNTEEALKIYDDLLKAHPENQEYLENYISIQFLAEDYSEIEAPLAALNKDFPDSKNIERFNNQIKTIEEKRKLEEEKKAALEEAASEN